MTKFSTRFVESTLSGSRGRRGRSIVDQSQATLPRAVSQRNTREDTSLPSVQLADLGRPYQLVLADPR